jgi:CheY-like chemotaxis protein
MPNLLLIEDDSDLRKVIQEAVEIDGYQVTLAYNAEEALALLNDGYLPTVIMCDITLPHMSGLDFLKQIRKNIFWSRIVIIAMSGTEKMQQAALDAGATYFLVKPFSFRELFDMLKPKQPY